MSNCNSVPESSPKAKRKPLPRTLWGLLKIACEDAQRLELNPRYRLNMGEWHNPRSALVCEVCMAGAVMARTLGESPERSATPGTFDEPTADRLYAINLLRGGVANDAYRALHGLESGAAIPCKARPALQRVEKLITAHYSAGSGRAPWFVYARAVEILKGAGL
jgi:hypothetical protein